MDVMLIQILAFMAVVLLVVGANSVFRGKKKEEPGNLSRPWLFRMFALELVAVGDIIGPSLDRSFPNQRRQINNDLMAAALYEHITAREIRGLQGFLGLVLGISVGVLVLVLSLNGVASVVMALVVGLVGFLYPVMWLNSAARRRRDAISKALPYAIDLMAVAMQAGQDFGASVRHFVREGPRGPLVQELDVMLRETDFGKSRIEAMKSMAGRIQLDEFQSVVTSVVQSSELGASVTSALKSQADEIRRSRFHRAERKAARAPSLMIIPVALFIVPSVFIIILTPIFMRIFGTLKHAT